jgi:microcin C transport system substrate-binding protein
MNRRSLLKSALLPVAASWVTLPVWTRRDAAHATAAEWRHGISPFGELKYAPGFKHFDYVNANAPKAGTARSIALGTFDNFNLVVAGLKGSLAYGIDLTHDTLLVPSLDEVSCQYGLLAEAVMYPPDYSWAAFRLRAEAKWHDGKPITASDVVFSFDTFKKLSPLAAATFGNIVSAEETGPREVTFKFDKPGNRALPGIIGQLNVLPKAWWDGVDEAGKKRSVGDTTLEPPLGSGPYRIKQFSPGRSIVYERVKDYWGKDLNVNIGRDNFDELRFEYFRDATTAIEAFKADVVDWRVEQGAKNWATAYDFAAVTAKRVVLEEFPVNHIGIMQAFALNVRRDKFKDARVRRALNYAFNFEGNRIFYGQNTRIASYFEGTELAATSLPTGRELALLNTVRDQVPAEVFTTPYTNPVNETDSDVRTNLRHAARLLKEAGYDVRADQLVNRKTGERFEVEFLGNNPLFERIFLFYKPALERLGIAVSVRTVDEPQYVNRLRSWDFDILTYVWSATLMPGAEQRNYWGSQAADQPGSQNVIGIKNPAVDALIEHVIFAKSREDLVAASRALDRVLLWNHYVVPQWTYNKMRVARWDRFGRPEPLPKYGMAAFPTVWWWDEAKVAKVAKAATP